MNSTLRRAELALLLLALIGPAACGSTPTAHRCSGSFLTASAARKLLSTMLRAAAISLHALRLTAARALAHVLHRCLTLPRLLLQCYANERVLLRARASNQSLGLCREQLRGAMSTRSILDHRLRKLSPDVARNGGQKRRFSSAERNHAPTEDRENFRSNRLNIYAIDAVCHRFSAAPVSERPHVSISLRGPA